MWGSPGSGKTTVAVRLAKYLADKRRNVILLLCDLSLIHISVCGTNRRN